MKVDANYSACENVEEGIYSLSVPDLGELYGTALPVAAEKNFKWPFSYYGDDEIEPKRTAASQLWYGELTPLFLWSYGDMLTNYEACNATIKGETQLALSWGVYNSNGSSPWGCTLSRVIRIFDIPCDDVSASENHTKA